MGLNLTWEVRDGILNHQKSGSPATLEGRCVRIADKVAYINHDLDDAVRAGVLKPSDVPNDITDVLGKSSKERINTAITSVWRESYGKNSVAMGKEVEQASEALRAFMFERVYLTEYARGEEEKAERMLSCMYEYFMKNADKLPEMFVKLLNSYPVEQVVCDYISSMTDRYAIYTFNKIFVPRGWTFVDETSFK